MLQSKGRYEHIDVHRTKTHTKISNHFNTDFFNQTDAAGSCNDGCGFVLIQSINKLNVWTSGQYQMTPKFKQNYVTYFLIFSFTVVIVYINRYIYIYRYIYIDIYYIGKGKEMILGCSVLIDMSIDEFIHIVKSNVYDLFRNYKVK